MERFVRLVPWADRKSTRLNSSHSSISYAVVCLKKKIYCPGTYYGTQSTRAFLIFKIDEAPIVPSCKLAHCVPAVLHPTVAIPRFVTPVILTNTAPPYIYTLSLHDALPIYLVKALDAMPEKELITGKLVTVDGEVCALGAVGRSEEHTSELQSQFHLVCRRLLEKKNILPRNLLWDAKHTCLPNLQDRRSAYRTQLQAGALRPCSTTPHCRHPTLRDSCHFD